MLKLFDTCPQCGKGHIIVDLTTLEHHDEKEVMVKCTYCNFKTTIPKPP